MSTVDWDFGLLEELIQDRGDEIVHELGVPCPSCRNDDPYASTIDIQGRPAYIRSLACRICQGNGYMYRDPQVVKGLVVGVNPSNHKMLLDAGIAAPGDSVFSPSLNCRFVGPLDRFTFLTAMEVSGGQVIVRGAATAGENAMLRTDLLTTQDRLWYLPEVITWCEDADGVLYQQDSDFTIAEKKITWINSPTLGTPYSIKYRAFTEWIAQEVPMERFDRARNLAQKVLLKKKHVHFQAGSLAESPAARKEEATSFNTVVKI